MQRDLEIAAARCRRRSLETSAIYVRVMTEETNDQHRPATMTPITCLVWSLTSKEAWEPSVVHFHGVIGLRASFWTTSRAEFAVTVSRPGNRMLMACCVSQKSATPC